jgi:hypothetical protein
MATRLSGQNGPHASCGPLLFIGLRFFKGAGSRSRFTHLTSFQN